MRLHPVRRQFRRRGITVRGSGVLAQCTERLSRFEKQLGIQWIQLKRIIIVGRGRLVPPTSRAKTRKRSQIRGAMNAIRQGLAITGYGFVFASGLLERLAKAKPCGTKARPV